jgi:hypothetical protein
MSPTTSFTDVRKKAAMTEFPAAALFSFSGEIFFSGGSCGIVFNKAPEDFSF